MTTATATVAVPRVFRHSKWDALLVALAIGQGVVLVSFPIAPVIALSVWWGSNTVAHYFIHNPFFRAPPLNVLFSFYVSALVGVPQTIWRQRHLAHHAGLPWRLRLPPQLLGESALVLALWGWLLASDYVFFVRAYVPGFLVGLALCALHGHYEHARGTISHYGTLYNWLFFNDGYHVEHHANPQIHWTRLPRSETAGARASRWPAVLRWLDAFTLEGLERWVLRSHRLQMFVLRKHELALRRLLPELPPAARVAIVGGGLFPRTALILRKLLPQARLVIIDRDADNVAQARRLLDSGVEYVNECYDPVRHDRFDVLIIPLSFVGDRRAIYRDCPAPAVLVHDWIWRRRGTSAVVSMLLLKRLNLVRG